MLYLEVNYLKLIPTEFSFETTLTKCQIYTCCYHLIKQS